MHAIDVGDMPGHQLRLAEAQATYGGEAPVLDGVKVREIRGVLVSDYVGGTGKFKGIRGTLFTTGFSDLKTKTRGTQTEGEYWFEQ